jgi:hypothetical protein
MNRGNWEFEELRRDIEIHTCNYIKKLNEDIKSGNKELVNTII